MMHCRSLHQVLGAVFAEEVPPGVVLVLQGNLGMVVPGSGVGLVEE